MFRADCTHRRIFLTYVYYIYGLRNNYRRKFRSQTSDNMDRWKAEQGRGREKRKIRRKEDGDARKGRKVAKHSEGRKVGALKRRVRSQLARWAMKNCTLLWREADFQVKMYKTHQDHFWQLRCRKSARRCGAKHSWRSIVYGSWFTIHSLRAMVYEPWFTIHSLRAIVYRSRSQPSQGCLWKCG